MNLIFLAFTGHPQNIFWFIVKNEHGQKTAHHCDGCGLYIANEKAPSGDYRQIRFEDLKDFPEVRSYIQSKL